ncbi:MAG: hypothetical protein J4N76_02950 [Chloroflexi bacterium]|nr:hypothetical protein [Chloroflexota bacterium]MDK1044528.1 hypothetical protein [Anaerolineales bacterium]MCI0772843.1 hypothetical protein [Chloroflexota bacterium]MCI0805287.1 hypothetical protein [Chloroflexota bacterium]MCI0826865.1 hypothetical protein [Chloroflexota bacterium]
MSSTLERTVATPSSTTSKPIHAWLKQLRVSYVPGETSATMDVFAERLFEQFAALEHEVLAQPEGHIDVLFATARYGEPVPWRQALLFTARRRYGLENDPEPITLVDMTLKEYEGALEHLAEALDREPPDPADFEFPGLAPDSYRVLVDQGRRGGPILALERLVQAHAKSIRVILMVGDEVPLWAHYFDLVGGHPKIELADEADYRDLVMRVVTVMSTEEVTHHEVAGEPLPNAEWVRSEGRKGMLQAGPELGRRKFFTAMVRISDIVQVPAVSQGVASQYSEGCFATWDPGIGALIATVTGSARPVEKDDLKDQDLAVIIGVREDGLGALVRHVEGKQNDPPSSEAVELMDMDTLLPRVDLDGTQVPVVRSKLHGHRGIASYDPEQVEYAPLDPPYYHYPVSCATSAQAEGIKGAFSRAEALLNPNDPRQLAFTVLPGHGVIIAEKWVPGKVPFQFIWEAMDSGALQVDNRVPQGMYRYIENGDGAMVLDES